MSEVMYVDLDKHEIGAQIPRLYKSIADKDCKTLAELTESVLGEVHNIGGIHSVYAPVLLNAATALAENRSNEALAAKAFVVAAGQSETDYRTRTSPALEQALLGWKNIMLGQDERGSFKFSQDKQVDALFIAAPFYYNSPNLDSGLANVFEAVVKRLSEDKKIEVSRRILEKVDTTSSDIHEAAEKMWTESVQSRSLEQQVELGLEGVSHSRVAGGSRHFFRNFTKDAIEKLPEGEQKIPYYERLISLAGRGDFPDATNHLKRRVLELWMEVTKTKPLETQIESGLGAILNHRFRGDQELQVKDFTKETIEKLPEDGQKILYYERLISAVGNGGFPDAAKPLRKRFDELKGVPEPAASRRFTPSREDIAAIRNTYIPEEAATP